MEKNLMTDTVNYIIAACDTKNKNSLADLIKHIETTLENKGSILNKSPTVELISEMAAYSFLLKALENVK